jgi:hypothetical protein
LIKGLNSLLLRVCRLARRPTKFLGVTLMREQIVPNRQRAISRTGRSCRADGLGIGAANGVLEK